MVSQRPDCMASLKSAKSASGRPGPGGYRGCKDNPAMASQARSFTSPTQPKNHSPEHASFKIHCAARLNETCPKEPKNQKLC